MTINIHLSTESIASAIRQLETIKSNLDDGLEQLVTVLTQEGAEQAQSAYGEWPVEVVAYPDGKTGDIVVVGDMPAIAEFGAGDATLSGGFENTPAEARPGSYSEEHAKQYAQFGKWWFGGEEYTEVPAHRGLYAAKTFIIDNATDIAQEVIQL